MEVNATEVAVKQSIQVSDRSSLRTASCGTSFEWPQLRATGDTDAGHHAGDQSEQLLHQRRQQRSSARGTFSLSVGGSRVQSTDWLLDGNDNNELDRRRHLDFPPIDAIQEFKVLTYNYSAEYGDARGSDSAGDHQIGQQINYMALCLNSSATPSWMHEAILSSTPEGAVQPEPVRWSLSAAQSRKTRRFSLSIIKPRCSVTGYRSQDSFRTPA